MTFQGAALSLTSAVSAAVAAAIVEITATAQPQLTSDHITVELAPVSSAGSASTPGVLTVQATVPVDTVELGRAVASAAQSGISGGAVATKVSQSAGVEVTAKVQTAELATQDGQLVEDVYVAVRTPLLTTQRAASRTPHLMPVLTLPPVCWCLLLHSRPRAAVARTRTRT